MIVAAKVSPALLLAGLLSITCLAQSSFAASTDKKISGPAPAGNFVAGNIEEGKFKSEDNRCQECHGADGNGVGLGSGAAGKFAKLAGQSPDYMVKQIRDFRTGTRKNDLMVIMAKSIDDADAADIAAYFASQKKMQGDGATTSATGKNLFSNGDVSRGILPCASCHGADGKGLSLIHI